MNPIEYKECIETIKIGKITYVTMDYTPRKECVEAIKPAKTVYELHKLYHGKYPDIFIGKIQRFMENAKDISTLWDIMADAQDYFKFESKLFQEQCNSTLLEIVGKPSDMDGAIALAWDMKAHNVTETVLGICCNKVVSKLRVHLFEGTSLDEMHERWNEFMNGRVYLTEHYMNILSQEKQSMILQFETCAICLEVGGANWTKLNCCTHRFHTSCAVDWSMTNLSCPLCRKRQLFTPQCLFGYT